MNAAAAYREQRARANLRRKMEAKKQKWEARLTLSQQRLTKANTLTDEEKIHNEIAWCQQFLDEINVVLVTLKLEE